MTGRDRPLMFSVQYGDKADSTIILTALAVDLEGSLFGISLPFPPSLFGSLGPFFACQVRWTSTLPGRCAGLNQRPVSGTPLR